MPWGLNLFGRNLLLWGRCALTLLDDLLGLLSDSSVPQEPPLTLLADLTLQVMLFRDL